MGEKSWGQIIRSPDLFRQQDYYSAHISELMTNLAIYLTPPTPTGSVFGSWTRTIRELCWSWSGALAAMRRAPRTSLVFVGLEDGCVRGAPEPRLGRFGGIAGAATSAGMRCRSRPGPPFLSTPTRLRP